jgi:hypothetical protein
MRWHAAGGPGADHRQDDARTDRGGAEDGARVEAQVTGAGVEIVGGVIQEMAGCVGGRPRRCKPLEDSKVKYLITAWALLIVGCAQTNSGPIAAGKDTYVLYRQAGAFPTGKEPLLAEALAEANSKCDSEKKKLVLLSSTENPGPYVLHNYPKATVIFRCE